MAKPNPTEDELLAISSMRHFIQKDSSYSTDEIVSHLSSYPNSKKKFACPYCDSLVEFGAQKCPLSHDLDWCPATQLLIVDLDNKHCRNCDLLYIDLDKKEGFEWIHQMPQVCITCGEVLRNI